MDYVECELTDVAAATKIIRGIAKMGSIKAWHHCSQKRMPYRGFVFQDLQAVLSEGEVHEPPKPNDKTGKLRYKVVGQTTEGDIATVVVEIVNHRCLEVITVFGE